MTDAIRFHLDESVDPAVADGLRRRGVDVTTSHETGLLRASDERQISFAAAGNRVLVTHDDDFLALVRRGNLHNIDLTDTAVTLAGVAALKQRIPSLIIVRTSFDQ